MASSRNLLLVGGVGHPFDETGPELARILEGVGWQSEVCFDIEGGLERLSRGEFDQLTVACLRWTMTQHEKYAPLREQWAFSLSSRGRDIVRTYLAHQNGLLGIHGAAISFDDWPEWGTLLGVSWRWGTSYHPPLAEATVRMTGVSHPITAGAQSFTVSDELYSALDVQPWMQPLFEARHTGTDEWRPVGFAGERDGARRAYWGLGHDLASLANPIHQQTIQRAARWLQHLPASSADF